MATLREVRARIVGVKKTQKITKAMKMVAAAKLRRAQGNVVAARPYARTIRNLLKHLLTSTDVTGNPLISQREVRSVALVVVTADRGLCGAFNNSLIKAAVNHIDTHYATLQREGHLRVFCVGKKGLDFFSKRHYAVAGKYIGVYNNLIFGQAQTIAREVISGYLKGEYDKVEILFNEFKSIALQRAMIEQFLPVPIDFSDIQSEELHQAVHYIYEPSAVRIIDAMLPKHLNFQIWRSLLESNAAEQGARMTAMENATENANDMISSLQLVYNKARQASITKELLEIVSGAEALKKAG